MVRGVPRMCIRIIGARAWRATSARPGIGAQRRNVVDDFGALGQRSFGNFRFLRIDGDGIRSLPRRARTRQDARKFFLRGNGRG